MYTGDLSAANTLSNSVTKKFLANNPQQASMNTEKPQESQYANQMTHLQRKDSIFSDLKSNMQKDIKILIAWFQK